MTFQTAFEKLPEEGLQEIAKNLSKALESTGEQQRKNYWKNQIKPFWKDFWPKSLDRNTDSISASFACMSIAARYEFLNVWETVQDWIIHGLYN